MLGDLLSKFGLTNIMGTLTMVMGVALSILAAIGCMPGATDFAATCEVPWLPESWLPLLIGITGGLGFLSKLLRPGTVMRNLFGGTAVIVPYSNPNSGPGTVTPEQVDSK
jgi:hypothetical protein